MTRKTRIFGCSLSAALTLSLLLFARPFYSRYKEERALRQAKEFLAQGDVRSGSLCVRQALLTNPRSLEACRLMAELADATGSPQMLEWRSRVVELAPTLENKLSLAAAALHVEPSPYPRTTELLSGLRSTASNQVAYCNLSADLAVKLGQHDQAEHWFRLAQQLQPSNSLHRLNLAVLRLGSTNALIAAEARSTLMSMRSDRTFATLILRSLVADSLFRKDFDSARKFSTELVTLPGALFSDRLRHLDSVVQPGLPEFYDFLHTLQPEASTNAASAYEVATCLLRHGLPERALQWLTNCSQNVQATQPVPLAKVNCWFALKDWAEVEEFLSQEKWNEFEPLRLALLSRAAAELHDAPASDWRWRLAVKQAQGRLGSLMWLAARAQEWGRDRARVDLLWKILKQFPAERWAVYDLSRHYVSTGDTRGLYQLCSYLTSLPTEDRAIRNNFALTSLLLKTNQDLAHETASELYVQFPGDPAIVSTRAYSLHLQGRSAEALEAMERLDEPILARPNIALYYGALLQALDHGSRARRYLEIAQSAPLLPEERVLLETSWNQAVKPSKNGAPADSEKARP